MANAFYPLFKEALLSGGTNVSLNVNTSADGPYVALVDTGSYTYSLSHQFYSSLTGVVGTDQRITTPTLTASTLGVTFDGDDCTFTSLAGPTVEAILFYRHNSGANTTWRLVTYLDTGQTGLPFTPNGGNITLAFPASGIWVL